MTERPRVLVVDDEEKICGFLALLLRKSGYEVHACHSGPDALQAMSEGHFDLLLTDFVMPRMDGAELIRYARKLQPGIPVVVITGFGTVDVATQVMQAGADDYISKPFDLKQLQNIVGRYLTKPARAADCEHTLKELRSLDENLNARQTDMARRAAETADRARRTLDDLTSRLASTRALLEVAEAAAHGGGLRSVAQAIASAAARETAWPSAAVFVPQHEATGQFEMLATHNWRGVLADPTAPLAEFVAQAVAEQAASLNEHVVSGHMVAVAPIVDHEAIAAVCAAAGHDASGGQKPIRVLQTVAEAAAQPLGECLRFRDAQIECWQMAERLIVALEGRSRYRQNHAQRVAKYALAMGQSIGLSEEALADLERGAILHDVGEMTMAPSILDKPDALTDTEVELMK